MQAVAVEDKVMKWRLPFIESKRLQVSRGWLNTVNGKWKIEN